LVQAEHSLYFEARRGEKLFKFLSLEAPFVAHSLVDRAKQRHALRRDYDQRSAGVQEAATGFDGDARMVEILKHVKAEDRVETPVAIVKIGRLLRIDAAYAHIRRAQEAIPKRVKMESFLFGCYIKKTAAHEAAGEVADSSA